MSTMFVVSCRKDFWSATEFSPKDEIRQLDLDSGNGPVITPAAFLGAMAQKRITVLVHGYNNERLDVLASYRNNPARKCGCLVFLERRIDRTMRSWASLGRAVRPVCRFPSPVVERMTLLRDSARLLADLRGRGATVDLNTHSVGAHVAFEALRELRRQVVRNAWNFASAVHNESVEQGERYFDASRQSARVYVFHSKNDPVLQVRVSRRRLFRFPRHGARIFRGPRIRPAIIDHSQHVKVINCKDVVTSHGRDRSSGQVWSFMAQELTSPTNQQFVTLKKTPQALAAVFQATGGASPLRRRLLQGVGRRQGVGGERRHGGRPRRTIAEAPRRAVAPVSFGINRATRVGNLRFG